MLIKSIFILLFRVVAELFHSFFGQVVLWNVLYSRIKSVFRIAEQFCVDRRKGHIVSRVKYLIKIIDLPRIVLVWNMDALIF